MDDNIILATDSYKFSHWRQYPPGITRIFSFFESRGGEAPETLFYGLQYYLKRYLTGVRVTDEVIEEAREVIALHMGDASIFNEAGWRHIQERHGGRLPVEIRAVREGERVPVSNALMTVVNTDSAVPWLTNHLETLLCKIWYPISVGSRSYKMRGRVSKWLEKTGDPSLIDFKVHDFGYRGSTSEESAWIGGGAHLVNFKGSDTMGAIRMLRKYYGEPMAGFSIPAAEHSTITSWGRAREVEAYRNMLEQFPTGFVAVVSDSYDIYNACRIWGTQLRDQVLARDGVLVVRPDSGHPPEAVVAAVMRILGNAFGSVKNGKGYKILDPHIRVIQGDGIDYDALDAIPEYMADDGWSTDNITFGSGGGLLQKGLDRDTHEFAFKCSAVEIDGVWYDVMKDPITDSRKRSKAGRLKLVRVGGRYATVRYEANRLPNLLEPVFRDGEVLRDEPLSVIRARALGL